MDYRALFPLVILFLGLTMINLYFRKKVLASYKKLSNKNVQFGWSHIWNKEKMEREVYPKHDQLTINDIDEFLGLIKKGIQTFLTVLVIIALSSWMYIKSL